MCTSGIEDKKAAGRIAFVYLAVTMLCAVLGAVYELFSHEVYSFFMIYAFAFPLCFGVFPYLIHCLFSQNPMPDAKIRFRGHAGVAALTVGSIISGVLEIYGTTNRLTILYWVLGALYLLDSVFRFLRHRRLSADSKERGVHERR